MLIINAEDQQKLLNMSEMVEAVGESLKEYSAAGTITPVRTVLELEKKEGNAIFMPAVAEGLKSLGMKYVAVFPENTALGKKSINGVVLLADTDTGEPLALLEGSYLTVMRTGALSGAASQYLSRADSKVLAILGTGEQVIGQFEAIKAVRDITQLKLYNRTREKAEILAEYIKARHEVDIIIYSDSNEAIRGADIIVTATSSSRPVFSEALEPGVHVNAIGSYTSSMQELPSHVIANADKVVVESIDSAMEEAGDLLIPINEGKFHRDSIHGELGLIIGGQLPGRDNDREVTVFKSVGLAVADVVVARYFYEKALKEQVGQNISLDTISPFSPKMEV
ncbi:MAG TPA: ornithine cyclodeaminase family protein [Bacillus bacterium]|uniref:ornithine cyclodeaminase family protein n=1 Tax=Siminovitchia fordii TaxID=254759 RepID=UPI000380A0F1|nr:ornithine cyclodeaminase family protein [Siminovitchia fordii]HBZ09994.1 ornithine cyclodeaminase family protein [Bacillus sp. (in: firmicutes)]